MLAIHPDCEEECSVCRHTAEKVEARWALKDIFLENSRNGNPNTSSELCSLTKFESTKS